jgi:hypothetical protein
MKVRIYILIAAALVVGAILYSGNAVLAQFGPNPIQAGALASKPAGVPTCLAGCPPRCGACPAMMHQPVQQPTQMHQQVVVLHHPAPHPANHSKVVSAKAVAVAQSTVVVKPQPVIVQTQPHAEPDGDEHTVVVAPAKTVMVKTVVVRQPAQAPVSQAPVVHTVAVAATPAPLPAAGSLPLGAAFGTALVAVSGYLYFRSRRLLRAASRSSD